MIQFQDAETGMFWQVIDKAGVPGNYLETSRRSLFAYAVLKACGWLPAQAVPQLTAKRHSMAPVTNTWA